MPVHQNLIVPNVHVNGSGRKELRELRSNACIALQEASQELRMMRPHGRDYFDIAEYVQACAQHEKRIEAVTKIMTELRTEQNGIYAQLP